MTKKFFPLIFILLFLNITPIHAIPVGPENDSPTVPNSVMLDGMQRVWQQFNRCAAAALTMQISYWRGETNYYDTIRNLNPRDADSSTRLDEMIRYAEAFGLHGIERMGGTLDLLKVLIANGFPVLVETVYYEEGEDYMRSWLSHNRVVMGYDDDKGEFYVFDSLLGFGADNTGRAVKYADLEERWRQLNRSYMVLYEPEQEAQVRDLMGIHWGEESHKAWLYEQVLMDMENKGDAFDHFNLGTTLTLLERYEEAVVSFDKAREIGLPFRMMWYQFEIFDAYLAVGRIQDVQTLAWRVINTTVGVEEMYYYLALSYIASDDIPRAIMQLEQAIWYNQFYTTAIDLLAELQAS